MTSVVELSTLKLLSDLFGFLNAGKHLNRMAEPKLWEELDRERDSYTQLFKSLGYDLRLDERGFAWFHVQEASASVSKATRQIALLVMLIFEYKADAGFHLGRFTDWIIDEQLLKDIIEKHHLLLEAEGLASVEELEAILKTARNYGFAAEDGSHWRLLPAVFRYLDHFEELSRIEEADLPELSQGTEEDEMEELS